MFRIIQQRHLIAVGELRAALTLPPHLARQLHFVHLAKTKLLKEIGLIGEAEDGFDAQTSRLLKASSNQQGAGTSVLYLSHVAFERLGFPELGSEPVPELNDQMAPIILPTLFVGGVAILAGAHHMTSNRAKEG